MNRSARVMKLLDLLRRQRAPIPGPELAQRLGISLRTLYRDIGNLREQGADVVGDPGVGFELRPGFLLPALSFTEEELEALVLGARWLGQQKDPELARASGSAIARILSTLPPELRIRVETSGLMVPRREYVERTNGAGQPNDAGRLDDPEPWMPELRAAIRSERKLELQYRDAEGKPSLRTVWPFAIGYFEHARMLAAWCELRGDFRHFRADRIDSVRRLDAGLPRRRHELIREWSERCGLRPAWP